jgi:lactate permease
LKAALASYSLLALLLTAIAVLPPLHAAFNRVAVTFTFPATITTPAWANPEGFSTPSGTQVLKPLLHPGVTILLVGLMSLFAYRRANLLPKGARNMLAATWRSGKATSLTILSMVGMSVLMEYTGMTLLLAETFSRWLGGIFPLVSPLVGMLGAFATGSNNNSNVLFAPLQQNVAGLLNIDARLLLAAQTAGGALGSMIAPAKIILGCATTGLHGEQGQVLRKTLPSGLGIGLVLGMVALIAASGGGY